MTSQAESFCRNRRLFDVKRGVVYLRRTDNLAHHQWRHYGTVPAIKTHVIRDFGVTTRHSDVTTFQPNHPSSDPSLAGEEEETAGSDVEGGDSTNDAKESTVITREAPPERSKKRSRIRILEESLSHPHDMSVREAADSTRGLGETSSTLTPKNPDARFSDPNPSDASDQPPIPATSSSTFSLSFPSTFDPSANPSHSHSPYPITDDKPLSLLYSLPAFGQPFSTSIPDQHSFRQTHPAAIFPTPPTNRSTALSSLPEEGADFDDDDVMVAWGSRDWMKEADVTPKSYAPRRYPLMSRVRKDDGGREGGRGGGGGRRQLKTLTDFRSENGTVRVIRSLPPVTRTSRLQKAPYVTLQDADLEDDLDLHTIEREKTYAMLKRIDNLLEPSRAFFVSDLTSSQVELPPSSSPPSTLSDSPDCLRECEPKRDEHQQGHGQVNVHADNFQKYFSEDPDESDEINHSQIGSEEKMDPHQTYYDRIQARLSNFYGHAPRDENHPGKVLRNKKATSSSSSFSSQERTTHRHRRQNHHPNGGHSEPPRKLINDSLDEHSAQFSQQHPSLQTHQHQENHEKENDKYDDNFQKTSFLPKTKPGRAISESRPLPPLKNLSPRPVKDSWGEDTHNSSSNLAHSHSWNLRYFNKRSRRGVYKSGGFGGGGGGERGRGWGTLGEVVNSLEQVGVDYHLKCQDWIDASFS